MSQLGQAEDDLLAGQATMLELRVTIRGLPEEVQRIADAVEAAMAGIIEWRCFAIANSNYLIEILGFSEYGPDMCPLSDIDIIESLEVHCSASTAPSFQLATSPCVYYSVNNSYSLSSYFNKNKSTVD